MIYNGVAEASMTPPGWNGWLHHTVDMPPTEDDYTPRDWEKPHLRQSHRHAARLPPERLDAVDAASAASATGDYKAWTPGG